MRPSLGRTPVFPGVRLRGLRALRKPSIPGLVSPHQQGHTSPPLLPHRLAPSWRWPRAPEPPFPGLLGTEDQPVGPGGHGLPRGPGPGREVRGGQDPQWGPFLGKRVARVPRSTQDPGPVSSLFLTSGLPQPGPHGVCRRPPRLPRETLTFREELDILKFLCKDLWVAVFHKQMDSLRTNHQVGAPQADSRQRPEPWEPREGTPAQGSHSRPSPPWGLPTSTL